MKTFTLTAWLLCCSLVSLAQFQWLNPKPSGWVNSHLLFTDDNNGFMLNGNGDLIRSTDGGKAWSLGQNFPGSTAMDFADSTGFIAGYGGTVSISTDNGSNWQAKTITTDGYPAFKFVDAVSRDTLFALNVNGRMLHRSDDRGATWQLASTHQSFINTKAMHFVNSRIGFTGGPYGILRTTDGGATWAPVYSSNVSMDITVIKFFDDQLGFAYKDHGQMLKTTDGGTTWTASSLSDRIFTIYIQNPDTIYVAGDHGVMFKSTNGGATWAWISPLNGRYANHEIYGLHFFNEQSGIATGGMGRIITTTDGGSSWQAQAPTYTRITTLSFPGATTGYATAYSQVLKTTNAGQDWHPLPFTSTIRTDGGFWRAHFRNKDTGILVSHYPAVFHKTVDGGQTWQWFFGLRSGYDYTTAFHFVNDTTGYISFDNSTAREVYRTRDGGFSWTYLGYYYLPLTSFHFVSEQTGYATGYNKVYRTDDSAKTWTPVHEANQGTFKAIAFINPRTGYAVGDQGLMRVTNDSGRTWTPMTLVEGVYKDMTNIRFYNELVGYIVTDHYDFHIYETLDGGKTWKLDGKAAGGLKSIAFSDSSVYIGGDKGNLLRSGLAHLVLDSLQVKNLSACRADFSARVTAAVSTADSVWFEYGKADFTYRLAATPSGVTNRMIHTTVTTDLDPGNSYRLRLKARYKGTDRYSGEVYFFTPPLPRPVITNNDTALLSSVAAGNQWFRNDTAIAGATGQQYVPTLPGVYTVQYTANGCTSPRSAGVSFVTTALSDPLLEREVTLHPNPVTDWLHIHNPRLRRLELTLINTQGVAVKAQKAHGLKTSLYLKHLPPGTYVLTITDTKDQRVNSRTIIKL